MSQETNPNLLNFIELGPVTPDEELVRREGLCVGHPHPEWWLGRTGEKVEVPWWLRRKANHTARTGPWVAQQLCGVCPVKDACRRAVDAVESTLPLTAESRAGIWAGEWPGVRLERQRRQRAEAA